MASIVSSRFNGGANGIQRNTLGLEVYSTCPSSALSGPLDYRRRVREVARWSERAGCKGMLIYTDNSLADPWLVAQSALEATETLCPLVAVQPAYMHPYAVAKKISTYGLLYGRRVCLNMVAGGFRNDLLALDDPTPHDRRYDRLVEYAVIIRKLLEGDGPLTFEGEFYTVRNLTLRPPLSPELLPELLVSGSSPAGRAAARAIGATAVEYPAPAEQCQPAPEKFGRRRGLRVGVIARSSEDEAWRIARERFPEDRKGRMLHEMAMKVSDSSWHQKLSEMGQRLRERRSAYWLHPFENYKTFCPYLVGDYETVAGELVRYLQADYRTFILDIPPSEEELSHIGLALAEANRRFAA